MPRPHIHEEPGSPISLKAGLPASGSSYSPRLPALASSGLIAAFVPGHGGGSATESHRLPFQGPRATLNLLLL